MNLQIDDRIGARELGATLTQYGAVEAWERMTYGGLGVRDHGATPPNHYLKPLSVPESAIVTR
jgi:hypothetical protein